MTETSSHNLKGPGNDNVLLGQGYPTGHGAVRDGYREAMGSMTDR
jgi:hypothetical protein